MNPLHVVVLGLSLHSVPATVPAPRFLKPDAIALEKVLGSPPAPGSTRDRADFEAVLRHQRERSPADCRRAATVVGVSLGTLFGPTDGPLTAAEVATWAAFFEQVRVDTDHFVQAAKQRWGRPRPYQANDAVQPCVHREVTAAYPSGHAAISRVFARLLSELAPERAPDFDRRAAQVGNDRVVAGVHHPSDIEAGRKLGDEVFRRLMDDDTFGRELTSLRNRRASSR